MKTEYRKGDYVVCLNLKYMNSDVPHRVLEIHPTGVVLGEYSRVFFSFNKIRHATAQEIKLGAYR